MTRPKYRLNYDCVLTDRRSVVKQRWEQWTAWQRWL